MTRPEHCPGRYLSSPYRQLGLCVRCNRLHKGGSMEPAATLEGGAACVNWVAVPWPETK